MSTPLAVRTLELAEMAYRAGVKEEPPGSNRGKWVDVYQKWVIGMRHFPWRLGFAWCATFATFKVYQAAAELHIKPQMPASASSSELYAWAKRTGNLLAHPEANCLGLVRAGPHAAPGKSHEHTYLVESVGTDGYTTSIDGNWGQAVSKAHHRISGSDFARIV